MPSNFLCLHLLWSYSKDNSIPWHHPQATAVLSGFPSRQLYRNTPHSASDWVSAS